MHCLFIKTKVCLSFPERLNVRLFLALMLTLQILDFLLLLLVLGPQLLNDFPLFVYFFLQ